MNEVGKWLLLGSATAVVGTLIYNYIRRRHAAKGKWRKVGTLREISINPLKSGRRCTVDEATVTRSGLVASVVADGRPIHDRYMSWLLLIKHPFIDVSSLSTLTQSTSIQHANIQN
jgi:hypothetical protein